MTIRSFLIGCAAVLLTIACSPTQSKDSDVNIEYEKYQLANGLDVLLHKDTSDPIASVAIVLNVGSNREKPGRTGFAHFFEHMLFQVSENLEEGAFFKKIEELGGSFNGGTSNDFTVYYEVVPKDALEKILWMEADRMGYFINAVTLKQLEDEKPVVKNEKRQRVDNQPYGFMGEITAKYLYPEGHPYSWTVIGDLDDLQNATLEDVKEFYDKWYGPNNATLVVAGDIDFDLTKKLIEKYFGEIKAKDPVEKMKPQIPKLTETKKLYWEDEKATLPLVRLTWPTTHQYHEDEVPLDILAQILSSGKSAPLYKTIVEEKKYAPAVNAFHPTRMLDGTFNIQVQANAKQNLNDVVNAIKETLTKFDTDGFDPNELEKIKIAQETSLYNQVSSLLNKSFQLAFGNEFAGNPTQLLDRVKQIRSLTPEDVMAVYRKYIKDKPMMITSFVPKGQTELMVDGSEFASKVKVEDIVKNRGKKDVDEDADKKSAMTETIVKTESIIDRSKEPGLLPDAPELNPPKVWEKTLKSGLIVLGSYRDEVPLVQFNLTIKGGQLMDKPDKVGTARLVALMMDQGTKNKTPKQLEDAIDQLGANLNIRASSEYIAITGNCINRYFDDLMMLVEEMLTQPRWDESEFDRLKRQTITQITGQQANPNAVASNVYRRIMNGADTHMSLPTIGTETTAQNITLNDLKDYYERTFSPSVATLHVAGMIDEKNVANALAGLDKTWKATPVEIPDFPIATKPAEQAVFFVDIPNSSQSVFRLGFADKIDGFDPYFKMQFANQLLGGGTSAKLFQVLREQKGYTYGAYSFVQRNSQNYYMGALASIKANVTDSAALLFQSILKNYPEEITDKDLELTKNILSKSNALRFESLGSVLGMLQNISRYDYPKNYVEKEQQIINGMTLSEMKKTLNSMMSEKNMFYLVVGDAKTQMDGLKSLGYGDPILLDRNGNPVSKYTGSDSRTKPLN